MSTTTPGRAINLGRIVATPAALEAFTPEQINTCLARHSSGDWGEMEAEDLSANDAAADALAAGDPDPGRLFSAYNLPPHRLWVITDDPAGDPITTVLLPSDY